MPLKGSINVPGWVGTVGNVGGGGSGTWSPGSGNFNIPGIGGIGGWADFARINAGIAFPRIKVGAAIDRRDLGVPVGIRAPAKLSKLLKVPGVPAVRKPNRIFVENEPAKAIGIPTPPNTRKLPKLPPQILNPPIIQPPKTKGPLDVLIDLIKPNITTKVQPVGLDLGNLIQVGLGAYRDIKVAAASRPIVGYSDYTPALADPTVEALQNRFMQDDNGCNPNCLPAGYAFDKCGNVVKKRRRRRRRLATASDIKDLASLSAVTTGAEKKTWIATHPT